MFSCTGSTSGEPLSNENAIEAAVQKRVSEYLETCEELKAKQLRELLKPLRHNNEIYIDIRGKRLERNILLVPPHLRHDFRTLHRLNVDRCTSAASEQGIDSIVMIILIAVLCIDAFNG